MYSYSPEFINYATIIATTFFAVFVATCFILGCYSNKVKPSKFKFTDKFDLGYVEDSPQTPVNVSISEVADEGMIKMEQQIRTLQTQISKIEKRATKKKKKADPMEPLTSAKNSDDKKKKKTNEKNKKLENECITALMSLGYKRKTVAREDVVEFLSEHDISSAEQFIAEFFKKVRT